MNSSAASQGRQETAKAARPLLIRLRSESHSDAGGSQGRRLQGAPAFAGEPRSFTDRVIAARRG